MRPLPLAISITCQFLMSILSINTTWHLLEGMNSILQTAKVVSNLYGITVVCQGDNYDSMLVC